MKVIVAFFIFPGKKGKMGFPIFHPKIICLIIKKMIGRGGFG